jgi:hypothetical protein
MAVGAPSDTVPKLVRGAAKAGVPYVLPNWFGHDANNARCATTACLAATATTSPPRSRASVSART